MLENTTVSMLEIFWESFIFLENEPHRVQQKSLTSMQSFWNARQHMFLAILSQHRPIGKSIRQVIGEEFYARFSHMLVYSTVLLRLAWSCSTEFQLLHSYLLSFSGSFLLSMEKLNWRSKISLAKCFGTIVSIAQLESKISLAKSFGTIVSIAGAFVVTFGKGHTIISTLSSVSWNYPLLSSDSSWIIGGIFLAAIAFLDLAWYILQALILEIPSSANCNAFPVLL